MSFRNIYSLETTTIIKIENTSITPPTPICPFAVIPLPIPRQLLMSFCCYAFVFSRISCTSSHTVGVSCVCSLSLSELSLRLTHVLAWVSGLFLFMVEHQPAVWMNHLSFIPSPVMGVLLSPFFGLLKIMLLEALKYKSWCGCVFTSPGKYLGVDVMGQKAVGRLLKKEPNYFPKWLYHEAFPPETCDSSGSSVSLPILHQEFYIERRHLL